jgi:hypothetical protein
MANDTLALFVRSSSTYNLDSIPTSIDLVPESTFVREEARAVLEAPLANKSPPSNGMSGYTSLKSTVTRTWHLQIRTLIIR